MPYADIVVSSLTKVFSSDSNVMGGRCVLYLCVGAMIDHRYRSLVINPNGRHYATLKTILQGSYEDVYFDEDAIFMERNSRNFKRRVQVINDNAGAVGASSRAPSCPCPLRPHPQNLS